MCTKTKHLLAWNGIRQTLTDIAATEKCSYARLRRHWINAGRPEVLTQSILDKAMSVPLAHAVTMDGKSVTVRRITQRFKVSIKTVYAKIKVHGKDLMAAHFDKKVVAVRPPVKAIRAKGKASDPILRLSQRQKEGLALSRIPRPSQWEMENIGMR